MGKRQNKKKIDKPQNKGERYFNKDNETYL